MAKEPRKPKAPPPAGSEEERLIAQRKAINAALRAERSGKKLKARKLRNRHAILTGFAVLDWMEAHKSSPTFTDEVQSARDKWLTKPDERALFGLSPLTDGEKMARGISLKPRRTKRKTSAVASPPLSGSSADATAQENQSRETEAA